MTCLSYRPPNLFRSLGGNRYFQGREDTPTALPSTRLKHATRIVLGHWYDRASVLKISETDVTFQQQGFMMPERE